MNDFNKKNKFTFPSKNKNKSNNSKKTKNDNIPNKTFYPKLPTKFSKSQTKKKKKKKIHPVIQVHILAKENKIIFFSK